MAQDALLANANPMPHHHPCGSIFSLTLSNIVAAPMGLLVTVPAIKLVVQIMQGLDTPLPSLSIHLLLPTPCWNANRLYHPC